jgi:hypothetical protein
MDYFLVKSISLQISVRWKDTVWNPVKIKHRMERKDNTSSAATRQVQDD